MCAVMHNLWRIRKRLDAISILFYFIFSLVLSLSVSRQRHKIKCADCRDDVIHVVHLTIIHRMQREWIFTDIGNVIHCNVDRCCAMMILGQLLSLVQRSNEETDERQKKNRRNERPTTITSIASLFFFFVFRWRTSANCMHNLIHCYSSSLFSVSFLSFFHFPAHYSLG